MQQPRGQRIADIAEVDPIAAYGILMGVPRTPITMNVVATFASLSLPQNPIVAALDQTIAARTWIDSMKYSILVPNCFPGNVFKTTYDAALLQAPGVSVQILTGGGPKYVFSPTFTPLENVCDIFTTQWPAGWPLFKQQNIQCQFQLTQTQPAPPMTVTLTFRGWQFLDPSLDNMSADTCARRLRNAGYFVPGDLCQYDKLTNADPNVLGSPPDASLGCVYDGGVYSGQTARR